MKWPDQSLIGVKVKRGNSVRTIAYIFKDIPGGVRLDKSIDGFVSWNLSELEILYEKASNCPS